MRGVLAGLIPGQTRMAVAYLRLPIGARRAFEDHGLVPEGWRWCPSCDGAGTITTTGGIPVMTEVTRNCPRCPLTGGIVPAVCSCTRQQGCAGEGYEPGDPRTCTYCRDLDGEAPCPAEVLSEAFELPACVVEVGHPAGTLAVWTDGELRVCDRHRRQYDTSGLGPFHWQPIQEALDGIPR